LLKFQQLHLLLLLILQLLFRLPQFQLLPFLPVLNLPGLLLPPSSLLLPQLPPMCECKNLLFM
jgi:hypothetical protein